MHSLTLAAKAVRRSFLAVAATSVVLSGQTFAEETVSEPVERISVTGSAIKQTDMEGALPVTVISRADIDRTGVTNTAELLQQIPSMQGMTVSADSVGGGGGGTQTASIHDLGEQYTLVLLNGRRLAPSDSGSSIDVSSIPLAGIERVEVLTDGASALYGSDAIAGVVNFIMKDNIQGFNVNARYDKPEETGGSGYDLSFTGGFGDVDSDGYNVNFSYSRNSREQLKATDRDFSKTGMIYFTHENEEYFFFNGSSNATPGNAYVSYGTGEFDEFGNEIKQSRSFNPYSEANGGCDANNSEIGSACYFDYTSTIEIVPESVRDSVFLNGQLELTDNLTMFSDVIFSRYTMTTRIAPYPTGAFSLESDSNLVSQYVVPYLNEAEMAAYNAGDLNVSARWRALPAGNRTTEWDTTATNVVTGLTGALGEFEFSTAVTYSSNKREQNYKDGWLLEDEFLTAANAGEIDIFASPSVLDATSSSIASGATYSGNWENTEVTVKGFDFNGTLPLFSLPAGDVYLAVGTDARQTNYVKTTSAAQKSGIVLFEDAADEYDLVRDTAGMFGELQIPLMDELLLTTSLRYDYIGGVNDDLTGESVSSSMDDITYKVNLRYQVIDELVLRGSYGTGFKAPSMLEIAQPRETFGVTGAAYSCPFDSSDSLSQYCFAEATQYDIYREGAADLKPETSTQYSVGFVLAPTENFSLTMDYWNVAMEDTVTRLTQSQIFADADKYRDLFVTTVNEGTGELELGVIQGAVNVGETQNSGVDWNALLTNDFGWAELTTNFVGTYMLESERSVPGEDGVMTDSINKFGDNDAVTFRVVAQLSTTLSHGDFAHTLMANYKSGYDDQVQSVLTKDVDGNYTQDAEVQLHVPSYTKVNFQSKYYVMDNFSMTLGINNLFDTQPSLSLGDGSGHQVGYDPRYTDPYGRTFYLQADYSF
ncbi:TonB-dependent receptor [Shewanella surugensis]|uniref:TonB-dependent receptor n=1 Tax=Shewanella surugensis TaxID=212020 RepID=A0ABT0LDX5_9GAMM|nr:TonB-dependent receptor [Shewanella surugensis]MCL1125855.1 TonB-dependent receptor [Shewanella surugensis]